MRDNIKSQVSIDNLSRSSKIDVKAKCRKERFISHAIWLFNRCAVSVIKYLLPNCFFIKDRFQEKNSSKGGNFYSVFFIFIYTIVFFIDRYDSTFILWRIPIDFIHVLIKKNSVSRRIVTNCLKSSRNCFLSISLFALSNLFFFFTYRYQYRPRRCRYTVYNREIR